MVASLDCSGLDKEEYHMDSSREAQKAVLAHRHHYVSIAGSGAAGEVVVTSGKPGDAETFQWVDLQRGDTLLLSLATHRYLVAPKAPGAISADYPGPAPDRRDGSCFTWKAARR